METKEKILETSLDATELRETGKETIYIQSKPGYDICKRIFDIACSVLGLVVLSIPFLIISLVILIDSPGASPIYVQKRVGKGGKVFKFFKFRSMIPGAEELLDTLLDQNEADGPVFKIKEDPRITRFGSLIRKTSIDELPQLWNVLKGDMSLVGPRPPLPREVAMYDESQMQRLCVTPGLTCYWQIQPKRNSLTFSQWLSLDMKYISERSFATDLKILIKTVGAVCGLEGE